MEQTFGAEVGLSMPPLAFWMNGIFLRHCPHCGLKISSRPLTLLTACPDDHSAERPDRLYNKPTHIIIKIVDSLPDKDAIQGGWAFISKRDNYLMKFVYDREDNRADKHSGSFLYLIRADHIQNNDEFPLDSNLTNQTRLLIISSEVNKKYGGHKGKFTGNFTNYTRVIEE